MPSNTVRRFRQDKRVKRAKWVRLRRPGKPGKWGRWGTADRWVLNLRRTRIKAIQQSRNSTTSVSRLLEINWNYAVIERTDPTTLQSSLIPFDLGKLVLNHDASQDLALQPGDTITIFSQAESACRLISRSSTSNWKAKSRIPASIASCPTRPCAI